MSRAAIRHSCRLKNGGTLILKSSSYQIPRLLCDQSRRQSTDSQSLTIEGNEYSRDSWTTVTPTILKFLPRKLHLKPDHPISHTRELIQSQFPSFKHYNNFHPVVSTYQNFDSLGFPADHPGRAKSDTYYINQRTVLRTHTSAHEAEVFKADASDGYTICADVYRRDAIDRSHYPVFHQLEGARLWDRSRIPNGDIATAVKADLEQLPSHEAVVTDPNPTTHQERNPLQACHDLAEVEAVASHLKRSIENVVVAILLRANQAAVASGQAPVAGPIPKIRWIEAYFPHTSPSWELEVWWQGEWLELLGCGVILQDLLNNSGVPNKIGWAFGIGLERIAMLLYEIPDIRLFWSEDPRFLTQFVGDQASLKRFVPFSKYPACVRDISFWTADSPDAGPEYQPFHENDFMEIVRAEAGDLAELVQLVDDFKHPKTGKRSVTFRIQYRSMERTLTNKETSVIHEKVVAATEDRLRAKVR